MLTSTKTLTTKVQRDRYSTVAIVLHWAIAVGIAAQIMLGWHLEELEGLGRSLLLQIHKSVGITILVLTVARLAWRLLNPPPQPHSSLTPLERVASHWVHIAFYGLLLAMPLTGWAMVSMESSSVMKVFGAVPWPSFPVLTMLPGDLQDSLAEVFTNVHAALTWVMLGCLFLHVAGALKHHFISKDPTVTRMAPGVKPGRILEPRLIALPVIVAGLFAAVYLPTIPEAKPRPAPKDLASADIYLDIVGPQLNRRCAACHSDEQSRGGLSVASYQAVMHGGRGGAVIKPGDAKGSELFKRVNLPMTDKKYMPQGERPTFNADQMAAIETWIQLGAPQGPVGKLKLTDAQKGILEKARPHGDGGGDDSGLPSSGSIDPLPNVPPADDATVTQLENASFIVRKVDKASNLVDVNFNGFKPITDADIVNLTKIGQQILSLNLRKAGVTDAHLKTIGGFKNLRILRLQDNAITDAGVASLSGLGELQELTLVGTKVTDAAMTTVAGFKKLEALFIWNTGVTPPAIEKYKGDHKDVRVAAGVNPKDIVHDTTLLQPQN
jgi:cytochrome b561